MDAAPDQPDPAERARGPGRDPVVADEPEATFRVAVASRIVHLVALAILVVMTVGMLTATSLSWMLALFVLLVIVQTINTVQLWRWQVTADEGGIDVQQGLRPPRRVPWGQIRTVHRTLPPRIEIDGEEDLRLGAGISRKLLQRTAAHIGTHAARRRQG
jgi:hypothetical protein